MLGKISRILFRLIINNKTIKLNFIKQCYLELF